MVTITFPSPSLLLTRWIPLVQTIARNMRELHEQLNDTSVDHVVLAHNEEGYVITDDIFTKCGVIIKNRTVVLEGEGPGMPYVDVRLLVAALKGRLDLRWGAQRPPLRAFHERIFVCMYVVGSTVRGYEAPTRFLGLLRSIHDASAHHTRLVPHACQSPSSPRGAPPIPRCSVLECTALLTVESPPPSRVARSEIAGTTDAPSIQLAAGRSCLRSRLRL